MEDEKKLTIQFIVNRSDGKMSATRYLLVAVATLTSPALGASLLMMLGAGMNASIMAATASVLLVLVALTALGVVAGAAMGWANDKGAELIKMADAYEEAAVKREIIRSQIRADHTMH